MFDSEPKKSTATSEPNQALPALARLLGRQTARQLLAEKVMHGPASPVSQDRNASQSSDTTTKAK